MFDVVETESMWDLGEAVPDPVWRVPDPVGDDADHGQTSSELPGVSAGGALPGLERLASTPALAAVVATIDPRSLTGHDQVTILKAQQRLVSFFTARLYATMAALVESVAAEDDHLEDSAEQAAAAEIAAALRLTRRAADHDLCDAIDLDQRLPDVAAALEAGHIDPRRARTLLRGTSHLPIATARNVVDTVLDEAAELTTGQLAARLRTLCIAANPQEAAARYELGVSRRCVVAEAETDGTSTLIAPGLPPDRLAAGMAHINHLAKSLRRRGESRTMDQLRADVLLDLLEGAGVATRGTRGTVDVKVDLTTLVEISEAPGELAGYGPVIAEIARNVVRRQHRAAWHATVTDPDTGDIVATMALRRRPTASQTRTIHASYPTCLWPGCRMPATQSDLDHRRPHAEGGPTSEENLGPLCRHHHVTRHRYRWAYHQLPDGNHQFTSPLGHTYTTRARSP